MHDNKEQIQKEISYVRKDPAVRTKIDTYTDEITQLAERTANKASKRRSR